MTCYMRHLGQLFEVLGLEYDAASRARVDAAIRDTLGLGPGPACPEVWAALKALSADERDALPSQVVARLEAGGGAR